MPAIEGLANPLPRQFDDLGVLGLPGDVSNWDIRFDPTDAAHCERLPDGRIRFSAATEPDLVEGWLVVRHAEHDVRVHEMETTGITERFRYFSVELQIDSPVEVSLAFRTSTGRPVYFVSSGVSVAVERLDRWAIDPAGLASGDLLDWPAKSVIYQIFPDRFARGKIELVEGLEPWGSPPTTSGFQGGDLIGIAQNMAYLTEIGMSAIYLNPIFVSPTNHRYDTIDYENVDPALGGNAALAYLVEEAHRVGIRVVLDASFNHSNPGFFAFADLIEKGPDSRYASWFVVKDWPLRVIDRSEGNPPSWFGPLRLTADIPVVRDSTPGPPYEPTYETWYGVPFMPRIDLSDREARSYFLGISRRWVADYDVDGWRMDVAKYVDPGFWTDFRREVKEVKEDAVLIAEIMGDSSAWLQGDKFDATMNYTFRSLLLRYLARDEITDIEFLDGLTNLLHKYSWSVTCTNHNLIGSHDTPRFLTEARGELWRLELATVLQLTYPGMPGVYYGDEIGLEGGEDPGSRGAFDWDRSAAGTRLQTTVKSLAELRKHRESLSQGRFRAHHAGDGVVAFERAVPGESTVVVINRSSGSRHVELATAVRTVLWGDCEVDGERVTVARRSAVVVAVG